VVLTVDCLSDLSTPIDLRSQEVKTQQGGKQGSRRRAPPVTSMPMAAPDRRQIPGTDTAASLTAEAYKAERAHELMLNQATSAFEHAAISPLLFLNGGGAVAFLTLLGAVSDPKARFSASIGWAVAAACAWGVGLVLAALAASFGLVSQRAFAKKDRIERQQLERLLLEEAAVVQVLAGEEPAIGWKKASAEVKHRARRYQRLYELSRWASIAGFVIGVACAAISVA
jgi:hypothetical protein